MCFNSDENDNNILFDLGQIAAVLDFTHNSISRVLSDYTTMAGVL